MELTLRINLSSPRWLRRALVLGVPVAAMAVTGIAVGAPQKVFIAGEVLKAADLNTNFADLDTGLTAVEASVASLDTDLTALDTKVTGVDTRVTALEAAPTFLTATGTMTTTGALGADFVYQGMSVDLTPGTWRIDSTTSVGTTQGQADAVQVALWNDTASTEIPNSRSAIASTGFAGACPRRWVLRGPADDVDGHHGRREHEDQGARASQRRLAGPRLCSGRAHLRQPVDGAQATLINRRRPSRAMHAEG